MGSNASLLEMIREHSTSEQMKLPVFPAVAVEIQNLIASESFTLDQITDVICRDQAMASHVLRLANSAFFSGLRKIGSIRDAVMRLGAKQILGCIIAMGQKDCYRSRIKPLNHIMQTLWRHASACALGSRWLAEKAGYKSLAQEAFLAGLLHDVGKLLLVKAVESVAGTGNVQLSQPFILELLDTLHAREGYEFMERWNIPETYSHVARDHHAEEFNPDDTLLLCIRIVDQTCRKVGIGMHHEPGIVPATLPEVHSLGIKEITLAELEVTLEDATDLGGS